MRMTLFSPLTIQKSGALRVETIEESQVTSDLCCKMKTGELPVFSPGRDQGLPDGDQLMPCGKADHLASWLNLNQKNYLVWMMSRWSSKSGETENC